MTILLWIQILAGVAMVAFAVWLKELRPFRRSLLTAGGVNIAFPVAVLVAMSDSALRTPAIVVFVIPLIAKYRDHPPSGLERDPTNCFARNRSNCGTRRHVVTLRRSVARHSSHPSDVGRGAHDVVCGGDSRRYLPQPLPASAPLRLNVNQGTSRRSASAFSASSSFFSTWYRSIASRPTSDRRRVVMLPR